MSLLDIDVDKIDLGIIKSKLQEYMIYHYGKVSSPINYRSCGCINYIRTGNFRLVTNIDIKENNSEYLVMYYLSEDPSTIYIIRESIVYKKNYNLVYVPLATCRSIRLLTIKDVLGI